MRIVILFPTLPPAVDGIGDYTARLATTLASENKEVDVHILTATPTFTALPGVHIHPAFSIHPPRDILSALTALQILQPDWLLVQYNPFSYGYLGFNPYLPQLFRRVRTYLPHMRIATMIHEDFVYLNHWKHALITTWQRTQFIQLGRLSHVLFFSIEPWVRRYRRWFPRTPVLHLPVASNVSYHPFSREEARAQLGLPQDAFVLGTFGTLHPTKLPAWSQKTAKALYARKKKFLWIYAGPESKHFKALATHIPHRALGTLHGEALSAFFAATSLMIAPFSDGVSTRRGSFLAALQHGVPTVSTHGPLTDSILLRARGHAFALTPIRKEARFIEETCRLAQSASLDPMGKEAHRFYHAHFTWKHLIRRLLDTFREYRTLVQLIAA